MDSWLFLNYHSLSTPSVRSWVLPPGVTEASVAQDSSATSWPVHGPLGTIVWTLNGEYLSASVPFTWDMDSYLPEWVEYDTCSVVNDIAGLTTKCTVRLVRTPPQFDECTHEEMNYVGLFKAERICRKCGVSL